MIDDSALKTRLWLQQRHLAKRRKLGKKFPLNFAYQYLYHTSASILLVRCSSCRNWGMLLAEVCRHRYRYSSIWLDCLGSWNRPNL